MNNKNSNKNNIRQWTYNEVMRNPNFTQNRANIVEELREDWETRRDNRLDYILLKGETIKGKEISVAGVAQRGSYHYMQYKGVRLSCMKSVTLDGKKRIGWKVVGCVFECKHCGRFETIVPNVETNLYFNTYLKAKTTCPICGGGYEAASPAVKQRIQELETAGKNGVKNKVVTNNANKVNSLNNIKSNSQATYTHRKATPIVSTSTNSMTEVLRKDIEYLGRYAEIKDDDIADEKPVDLSNDENRYKDLIADKINTWTPAEKQRATKFGSEIRKRNEYLIPVYMDKVTGDSELHKSTYAKCVCNKCGEMISVSYEDRGKKIICPGCEKRTSGHINYVGRYKIQQVGTVRNGLKVIKQDSTGTLVDLECQYCGKIMTGINSFMFLNSLVCCGCEESKREKRCSRCKAVTKVSIEEILNPKNANKQIVCEKCGEIIGGYRRYSREIVEQDIQDSLTSTFGALEKLGQMTTTSDRSLVRETIPSYIGPSKTKYYRCTCLKCNREFTLSDNEIDDFSHEKFCQDRRYSSKEAYPTIDNEDKDNSDATKVFL